MPAVLQFKSVCGCVRRCFLDLLRPWLTMPHCFVWCAKAMAGQQTECKALPLKEGFVLYCALHVLLEVRRQRWLLNCDRICILRCCCMQHPACPLPASARPRVRPHAHVHGGFASTMNTCTSCHARPAVGFVAYCCCALLSTGVAYGRLIRVATPLERRGVLLQNASAA